MFENYVWVNSAGNGSKCSHETIFAMVKDLFVNIPANYYCVRHLRHRVLDFNCAKKKKKRKYFS